MLGFLRRRRAAALSQVAFCDSCAQVCTAACRAAARRDQNQTTVLAYSGIR